MKHWSRGMTLLEVMLALAIFAAGTVAVVELFQMAQWGSTEAENALLATQLAQARMEELRNVAYASLANEAKASVSSPAGFSRFSRDVTVTMPYTNLKLIVLTVYWTGTGGETNVSLSSYRSAV